MSDEIKVLMRSRRQLQMHRDFTISDIDRLRQVFLVAQDQKFGLDEFRALMVENGVYLNDSQLENLFLKINTSRDNHIDWNEFVAFLLLGFEKDYPKEPTVAMNLPIERPPEVHRSKHGHAVIRISFCPTVLPDRSVDNAKGTFITTSKDGVVNFWTLGFELLHTGISKNPFLKVAPTWITEAVSLSDINIFCTAATERDLRFYDTTANNFMLRIVVTSLPFAVSAMSYYFPQTLDIDSLIVLGDMGGNVRLIKFNSLLRGPFQSNVGAGLVQCTWHELTKGGIAGMQVSEYINLHGDIIRQVEYVQSLNCIISVAEAPKLDEDSQIPVGVFITSLGVHKMQTALRMSQGTNCFAFDEHTTILVTGGRDTILRVWNPTMPKKPVTILTGHNASIISIFIQDQGKKVYSMDKFKIIKVWNLDEQNLIQTVTHLITALPDKCPLVALYNDHIRSFVVAGMRRATFICAPPLRIDLTDGVTHTRAISAVLYNDLFKYIVTCGLDSFIIVWDFWTGERLKTIRMAHTQMTSTGELQRVAITAACFDPKSQLLLTGARNGTLKVWNFNTAVCVRNMAIEKNHEVTNVFWIVERILAVGWNRHVTEFSDMTESEFGDGKKWETCHIEDILAADIQQPEMFATSSYAGELMLWKLQTGQPYQRYDVQHPNKRLPTKLSPAPPRVSIGGERKRTSSKILSRFKSASVLSASLQRYHDRVERIGRLSVVALPSYVASIRPLAIRALVFLRTRPKSVDYGTLAVALDNGSIQIYSHHLLGGLVGQFNAVHMPGDKVISMATDNENRYLFTGTALGYIKCWLLINYCVPNADSIHVPMPFIRLTFPFVAPDFFDGRAKRSAREHRLPMLLNSYKGHTKVASKLLYVDHAQVVLSGSGDNSVRIWTLGGQYIGTLGSPVVWSIPKSARELGDNFDYRLPPDIRKMASSATLKVFDGGKTTALAKLKKAKSIEKQLESLENPSIFRKALAEPILGKRFALPTHGCMLVKPVLEKSLPYIPVYNHLKIHPAMPIERPKTPEVIAKIRNTNASNDSNDEVTHAKR